MCSTQQKNYLYRETEGRCIYCGAIICPDDVTCDHIVPRACGGDNSVRNYVACCRECNEAKGHLSVSEFVAGMSERRRRKYGERVADLVRKGYLSGEKSKILLGDVPREHVLSKVIPSAAPVRRSADMALAKALFGMEFSSYL